MDNKQTNEETEFVKDEQEPKKKYIFQNSKITIAAVVIVVAFLILLVVGLVVSGTSFFDSSY